MEIRRSGPMLSANAAASSSMPDQANTLANVAQRTVGASPPRAEGGQLVRRRA
ncbi:MAG: hypothetical protein ACE5JG_04160 [Planctomycetota bacterium]